MVTRDPHKVEKAGSIPARATTRPTIFRDGKQKLLHRVIMEEYLGRPLESDEIIHHINGNPFDNRIENLFLTTRSEHKKLHAEIGTATRLKRVWTIDPALVRRLYKKHTAKDIAKRFGCSGKTICRILKSTLSTQIDLRSLRTNAVKGTYKRGPRAYKRRAL